MGTSAIVIINPISGARGHRAGAADERRAIAERVAQVHRRAVDIAITTGRGHGADLARTAVARGVDRVVAWGGDGTVNEIAGPLIGSKTTFGIVPSGSGDGFARGLGLSREPDRAVDAALTAPARALDVGWLGGRHFLNIAGIGFDAVIAAGFNERRTRGLVGYVTGGLSLVWSYRAATYELRLDDQASNGERFLIAFANGRQYGNGIILAPDADFADGVLDAVIVQGGSPMMQLWRARRMGFLRSRPAAGIVRTRVHTASVTGDRLQCHVDGETFDATGRIDVRLQPGALLVAGA